jgi:hypothetical protein
MDKCPDLTGFLLADALARCRALGLTTEVMITRPRQNISGERLRVVRYKWVSGKVVLTAVFESTKKGGNK